MGKHFYLTADIIGKKLFFLLEIRSLFCRGDSDYYMISDMLCLLQACNENVFFFQETNL